jgi:hypothetical protein
MSTPCGKRQTQRLAAWQRTAQLLLVTLPAWAIPPNHFAPYRDFLANGDAARPVPFAAWLAVERADYTTFMLRVMESMAADGMAPPERLSAHVRMCEAGLRASREWRKRGAVLSWRPSEGSEAARIKRMLTSGPKAHSRFTEREAGEAVAAAMQAHASSPSSSSPPPPIAQKQTVAVANVQLGLDAEATMAMPDVAAWLVAVRKAIA